MLKTCVLMGITRSIYHIKNLLSFLDSGIYLLVTGKRLVNISADEKKRTSQQLKLYVVSNREKDSSNPRVNNTSDIDSDNETYSKNPVFLKSLKNNYQKPIDKENIQFSVSFFLLPLSSFTLNY